MDSLQEMENAFISTRKENLRASGIEMTWETEVVSRHAFSAGLRQGLLRGRKEGREATLTTIHDALGLITP